MDFNSPGASSENFNDLRIEAIFRIPFNGPERLYMRLGLYGLARVSENDVVRWRREMWCEVRLTRFNQL